MAHHSTLTSSSMVLMGLTTHRTPLKKRTKIATTCSVGMEATHNHPSGAHSVLESRLCSSELVLVHVATCSANQHANRQRLHPSPGHGQEYLWTERCHCVAQIWILLSAGEMQASRLFCFPRRCRSSISLRLSRTHYLTLLRRPLRRQVWRMSRRMQPRLSNLKIFRCSNQATCRDEVQDSPNRYLLVLFAHDTWNPTRTQTIRMPRRTAIRWPNRFPKHSCQPD